MSAPDKGAFTPLLARLKATGAKRASFAVDLDATEEDPLRWAAVTTDGVLREGYGRTGEEALRNLVEIREKLQ